MILRTILLALITLATGANLLASLAPDPRLRDFGLFVDSARALQTGGNPYGLFKEGVVHGKALYAANLNPPVSLIVFGPLANLPPDLTFRVFQAVSVLLYVVCVILLFRAHPEHASPLRFATVLAFTPLWQTVFFGQIYTFLLIAVVGAWLLLRRGIPDEVDQSAILSTARKDSVGMPLLSRRNQQIAAGILVGVVVAIKPNFGIWPLLLLAGGYATLALSALVTAAGLSILPALVFGPRIYLVWIEALLGASKSGIGWQSNASLISIVAPLGLSGVALILGGLSVVVLLAWVWKTRPNALLVSRFGLLVPLLISTISWNPYSVLLLPIFLERRWDKLVGAAAILFVVPVWLLPLVDPVADLLEGLPRVLLAVVLVRELTRPGAVRDQARTMYADAGAPSLPP